MMTQRRINRLLEYQETIEGMSNPFNRDIFYDLLEVQFWVRYLERENEITKSDLIIINDWNKEGNEKRKRELIGLIHKQMKDMDLTL